MSMKPTDEILGAGFLAADKEALEHGIALSPAHYTAVRAALEAALEGVVDCGEALPTYAHWLPSGQMEVTIKVVMNQPPTLGKLLRVYIKPAEGEQQ